MDTYSMYQGHTVTEIVTGKPVASGGTVGRREATGRGVVHLAMRAAERLGIPSPGTTAIVQGFGNVGAVAATELALRGVKVIGVSDHTACLFDHRGLAGFSNELAHDPAAILTRPCDILVPAALERVIDAETARNLQCRILAEAANGPTTPDADRVLEQRPDVTVIPDILCNAGGVIVSYFEWVQDLQQFFWEEDEVNAKLRTVLDRAYDRVAAREARDRVSARTAAMAIGVERVRDAKRTRGLFP
jgi:glutamate dehydrogenase (NAD(P)+)